MEEQNKVHIYLHNYMKLEERFRELKELRKKCYRVFDDISIEKMEKIIKNDWPKLYHSAGVVISDENIRYTFSKLKDGKTTRSELKKTLADTIQQIDNNYNTLKKKKEDAEAKILDAYQEFLQNYISSNNVDKAICSVLLQPEAEEIVMNFLKN